MSTQKEKELAFALIRNYFDNTPLQKITSTQSQAAAQLLQKTGLGGLAYQALKDTPIKKVTREELKNQYEAIKKIDATQHNTCQQIAATTLAYAPIGLTRTKKQETYTPGTIYTPHIEVVFFELKEISDYQLYKQRFFLEQIDILWEQKIREKELTSYNNPEQALELYEQKKSILANITRKNILRTQYARMKLFAKTNQATYNSMQGTTVKTYQRIATTPPLFEIPLEHVQLHTRKQQQVICAEDSLLINAVVFMQSFSQGNKRRQSLLSQLVAVVYLLEEKEINWQYLLAQTKRFGCSSAAWFYLHLAQRQLHANIPPGVIARLYQNSSKIQNTILGNINSHRLLFEEKDRWKKLFVILYLSTNIARNILHRGHSIIATIQQTLK
jgi:hypothetical protein